MTDVFNRSLFRRKAQNLKGKSENTAARDRLRGMGGIPSGIMRSSPEMIQAAMRQPPKSRSMIAAPMRKAMPLPMPKPTPITVPMPRAPQAPMAPRQSKNPIKLNQGGVLALSEKLKDLRTQAQNQNQQGPSTTPVGNINVTAPLAPQTIDYQAITDKNIPGFMSPKDREEMMSYYVDQHNESAGGNALTSKGDVLKKGDILRSELITERYMSGGENNPGESRYNFVDPFSAQTLDEFYKRQTYSTKNKVQSDENKATESVRNKIKSNPGFASAMTEINKNMPPELQRELYGFGKLGQIGLDQANEKYTEYQKAMALRNEVVPENNQTANLEQDLRKIAESMGIGLPDLSKAEDRIDNLNKHIAGALMGEAIAGKTIGGRVSAAAAKGLRLAKKTAEERLTSLEGLQTSLIENIPTSAGSNITDLYQEKPTKEAIEMFGVTVDRYVPKPGSGVGSLYAYNENLDTRFLSTMTQIDSNIDILDKAYSLLSTDPDFNNVAGLEGAVDSIKQTLKGLGIGRDGEVAAGNKYDKYMQYLAAQLAPAILGESGRTISDADRVRVMAVLGFRNEGTEKEPIFTFVSTTGKTDAELRESIDLIYGKLLMGRKDAYETYRTYKNNMDPGPTEKVLLPTYDELLEQMDNDEDKNVSVKIGGENISSDDLGFEVELSPEAQKAFNKYGNPTADYEAPLKKTSARNRRRRD
jgi:hypothetical protein